MNYEINSATCAVIPIDISRSKVYEKDNEYVVNNSAYYIMSYSCNYFGSSIEGRKEGTKNILGSIYKAPILVEETRNIIFFPTKSWSLEDKNAWISLNNILSYEPYDEKTLVHFKGGKDIFVDIQYLSFENQLLRAARLESVIRQRQET